jgi:hypothetical protein
VLLITRRLSTAAQYALNKRLAVAALEALLTHNHKTALGCPLAAPAGSKIWTFLTTLDNDFVVSDTVGNS